MTDAEEFLVLVDEDDREIGTGGKLAVHREGHLHRALSVVIRDPRGRLLLQKRSVGKYHSGGLWTNTCCSHPRPGEPILAASLRRLEEEMGIICPLRPLFAFTYRAEVGPELVEHEYDHLFVGRWDGDPAPSLDEVDGWRWVPVRDVAAEVRRNPEAFTPWFRVVLSRPDWAERLLAFQDTGR